MKNAIAGLLLVLVCGSGGVFAEDVREDAGEAALGVMEDFLVAFNARDEEAWADTLHFPHVRLASGQESSYQR